MNRIVRNHRKEEPIKVYEGDPLSDPAIEPGPDGNRFRLLPLLAGAIFIFALLYRSSYLALLWLPPYQGADMRSQLTADYSAWNFLVFQPVDPAMIEEIRQERGLPEQMIVDGSFWPTPASTLIMQATASHLSTATPQATFDPSLPSSTVFQPSYTSTPMPTEIILSSEQTVTPQPTESANPTKSRKPPKTEKPPKTPKTEKPPKTPKPG